MTKSGESMGVGVDGRSPSVAKRVAGRMRARFQSALRRRVQGLEGIESASREADFASLREQIRAAGTDSIERFGNGYTQEGGLSLARNPDEFAALCVTLARWKPIRNYLEIGSGSGGSCRFLNGYLQFNRVFILDDGRHPRSAEQEGNFRAIRSRETFIGDSHSEDARRFLAHHVQGTLDLAFLDGDHSYEGASADLRLVSAFSRPGTIVVLHDTASCEGMRRVWQHSMRRGLVKGIAEFVGESKPRGIGIGIVQ